MNGWIDRWMGENGWMFEWRNEWLSGMVDGWIGLGILWIFERMAE